MSDRPQLDAAIAGLRRPPEAIAAALVGVTLDDVFTSRVERSRVRFEAHMRRNHPTISLERDDGAAFYRSAYADIAWSTWLASESAVKLPTPEVRNLGDVQRLQLEHGDALVIRAPQHLNSDERALLRYLVGMELPGVPVLVLDRGMRIAAIRKAHADA